MTGRRRGATARDQCRRCDVRLVEVGGDAHYNPPMATPQEKATVIAAAKIVTQAMVEAGMEPSRAIDHPVVRGVIHKWLHGEWTQEETIDACRDLLMMYPELRAGM